MCAFALRMIQPTNNAQGCHQVNLCYVPFRFGAKQEPDWASNVPSSSVAKHGDATQITRKQCCNHQPRSPLFKAVWVWGYHISGQASKARVFDVLLVVVQRQCFLALMGINITVASSGLSVGVLCIDMMSQNHFVHMYKLSCTYALL